MSPNSEMATSSQSHNYVGEDSASNLNDKVDRRTFKSVSVKNADYNAGEEDFYMVPSAREFDSFKMDKGQAE